ncbi:MAG: DUF268 domain-containing protein [Candidatus Pacebacteria bacterium]|nr:DUF268 domain-containing protein [Candidatus Paceibacterota bacterium]
MDKKIAGKYRLRRMAFKFLRTFRAPLATTKVLKDLFLFKKTGSNRFKTSLLDLYPIANEKTATTAFDRHYVYHPAWAIRVVKEINPAFHVDISSTLHFCANLSAFIPVKFYDYRPASLILDGLETNKGDLMNLPFESNSLESISCMHTLEHVGLGRYGDPIDPDGDIKAIKELKRVLKSGGSLLIVTPVGKPRVEYNAHRIYSPYQVRDMVVDDNFTLKEFAFIPQRDKEGGLARNAPLSSADNAYYACGCFWFVKK